VRSTGSGLWRALHQAPPSRLDWLLFAVLAAVCYVLFLHTDIRTTGGASLVYLQGHLLDFYDYNARLWSAAHYLPSTYILFALWNIPLWLLGAVDASSVLTSRFPVLMWYKLLPTAAYLLSALLVYRLGTQAGLGTRKARLTAYVWLTTPIAFYSQFIFGQYDSLGILLVLLGLVFYFKKDLITFALLCGVAFTLKYFALIIFLPLLLLAEKRIPHILARAGLFLLPAILVALPYLPSEAFRQGVFGTPVASYILGASISNGYVQLQLFLVAWVFVCAWAYFVEPPSPAGAFQWSMFFTNAGMFLLFGMSFFHPQWLLWATPFWVISTFMNRKTDVFLVLDILMMLFFTAFSVTFSPRDVDQQLFALGLLKRVAAPVLAAALPMRDMFLLKDASFAYSALSALMLIHVVFKHPVYCRSNPATGALPHPGLIRTRFLLGIAIFLVPATASLIMALRSPVPSFTTARGDFFTVGPMTEGRELRQVFPAKTATLTAIEFMPGRSAGADGSELMVQLLDPAADAILFEQVIPASQLVDRAYFSLRLPSIPVAIGQRLLLSFRARNSQPGDYVTLYRTAESDQGLSHYAVVDGARQSYDLVVQVYGR
jgi:hypothetical protein